KRLEQLGELVVSRTLIIVISDLHDPQAIPAAKTLAQRHDVIVLHLQDPAERGELGGGMFHALEAETGRRMVVHGGSRWLEEPFEQRRRQLSAAGVDYLLLGTDKPFVAPLRRLLADRGGLMRNKR